MASRDDEFRKAVADAQPLKARQRVVPQRPVAAPRPMQHQRDEAAALAESRRHDLSLDDVLDADEDSSFVRDGVGQQALRKLRRGHWVIEGGLDLHGLTRDQAAAAVIEFLERCLARGWRCVRIVHGKGTGMLRAKLRKWLPEQDEVLAFCQAPTTEGGSGVLLVLLRSKKA